MTPSAGRPLQQAYKLERPSPLTEFPTALFIFCCWSEKTWARQHSSFVFLHPLTFLPPYSLPQNRPREKLGAARTGCLSFVFCKIKVIFLKCEKVQTQSAGISMDGLVKGGDCIFRKSYDAAHPPQSHRLTFVVEPQSRPTVRSQGYLRRYFLGFQEKQPVFN